MLRRLCICIYMYIHMHMHACGSRLLEGKQPAKYDRLIDRHNPLPPHAPGCGRERPLLLRPIAASPLPLVAVRSGALLLVPLPLFEAESPRAAATPAPMIQGCGWAEKGGSGGGASSSSYWSNEGLPYWNWGMDGLIRIRSINQSDRCRHTHTYQLSPAIPINIAH